MGTERDEIFDWDEANVRHIARHGVTPAEAESAIMNDPLDYSYELIRGEPRWTIAGHTRMFRVLVVTWTMRGDRIRVVTARQANKQLRDEYLAAKGIA